ncbi:MAG: translation initiation factor IF-2 [Bacillota bacterium]
MTEKLRVYELAKEMLVDSKVVIRIISQLGEPVRNHMSTMTPETREKVVAILTGKAKVEDFLERPTAKPQASLKERPAAEQRPEKKEVKPPVKRPEPDRQTRQQAFRAQPRKKITLSGPIRVADLSQLMGVPAVEIIKRLMLLGIMASINQDIEPDVAQMVASDMGFEVEQVISEPELIPEEEETEERPEDLKPRPPVVTVMGHVDHGKTSLLDAIRHANVTASEAGGITQHIGAYTVRVGDKQIVFIDTPGHEAFTAMRARGAQVTDIAVLVVAADDGVMPQTVEAINHAKAAGVPIVVAINKIDKPGANPERVKQQLTEHGLVPEEWGGDVIAVPVSARTKAGLDQLLEMILLVAEMEELKANPNRPAKGTVIEAELDKGRGPVATVVIRTGTLKVGDAVVVGQTWGKVRALSDDTGRRIKKVGPSMPAEVVGLEAVPEAGDLMVVVEDEKKARAISLKRQEKHREELVRVTKRATLEDLFAEDGDVRELNLVIKGDVQGSVEALRGSIEKLSGDEVKVSIIHSGVGAITESDVMLAAASDAIILGFNVRPDPNARRAAEAERVDIKTYRVIYEAIDNIKAALTGMLKPRYKETVIGRADVRQVFRLPKGQVAAGCYVTEGRVTRNASIRLIRDGVIVHEGRIESLRRFKEDVREVHAGFECGISIEKFIDVREGDHMEAYILEEVPRNAASGAAATKR